MAGSLVCALAPNIYVLIAGRVLHGLGGGGLTSTGMVILGDIAAPRDRGKYYGYFSATYTTAGACGPALGGFIAEYLHWSVIFWMNIPMGLLAVFLTLTLLKALPRHERPHKLDILGAGLIMTASVAFMLALSMGGVRYPWTSPAILALFAIAVVGVLISLYYYFNVIHAIYWSKGATDLTPIAVSLPTKFALAVCIVGMFWLGLNPDGALEMAVEAVKALKLAA